MNPNIERARQNEDQVLLAIGLVGWLTTAQVATWVWPASGAHAARNRAAEVLGRLLERGQLLRRQSALGAWAYLLTNAGAARANMVFAEQVFRNGYDLSQLDVHRQALIVSHLLALDSSIKLGPAGVRGAVRAGVVADDTLRHADALWWDPYQGHWAAAIVVRSMHPDLLAKARRLRAAASALQLLGSAFMVRQFGAAI